MTLKLCPAIFDYSYQKSSDFYADFETVEKKKKNFLQYTKKSFTIEMYKCWNFRTAIIVQQKVLTSKFFSVAFPIISLHLKST